MKTINYWMLEANYACSYGLKQFRDIFGDDEVELSKENLKIARDAKLNISFLGQFLSAEEWAEYYRVRDATWTEYRRVRNVVYDEYDRVRDAERDEYERVCDETLIEILSRD